MAKRLRVSFVFLPQYSPWLNPIEQLFLILKRELQKRNTTYSR